MGLSKDFMREIYQGMADDELLSAATNDIRDLTPEAMAALHDELKARGLNKNVNDAIEIQQKELTIEEFMHYVNLIRGLPCPVCGATGKLLNGAVFGKVTTVIVMSATHYEFIIACPDCLKKEFDRSGGIATAFGVTDFVRGIIESVKIANNNSKEISQGQSADPSESLIAFVGKKIGEIKLYEDNRPNLEELVRDASAAFS